MAVISNGTVGTLVSGTGSADTIYNIGANVTIQALGGNDSVFNSNEYIEEDDDSPAYSLGSNAKINGGDGDDTIRNEYAYRVSIDGGKGYDSIYNSGSYASINGGDGSDEIYNDDGWSATINGGKGNDSIKNGGGYASIVSGDGDDTITNGYYYDQYNVYDGGGSSINAGKGNDYIENIGGNVLFTYAKGDGYDVIRGFNETSVLQISGGTYSTQLAYDDYYDEDYTGYYDILVKVGTGSILLEEVSGLSGLKIGTAAELRNVRGTAGDDTLTNFLDKATITGLGGRDSIENAGSNVKIDGGDDDDSIESWSSRNTTILGGAGNDYIYTYGYNLIVDGGAGNDDISAYGETLKVDGGAGNDSIQNYGESVSVDGGDGNDVINNVGGTIFDSEYQTEKTFSPNDTTISGGIGNDTIDNNGANNVKLNGGTGNDLIQNHSSYEYDELEASQVTMDGGAGDDSIYNGNAEDDYYSGGGASVSIGGGAGNDIISNGGSYGTISGGDGDDSIVSSGWKDSVGGGAGKDTIEVKDSNGATVSGGDDNDSIKIAASDEYYNDYRYIGRVYASGDNGDDYVYAEKGEKITLDSGKGNDTLVSNGSFNVKINGGAGNDSINLQDSSHVQIKYTNGDGNDTIYGFNDTSTLSVLKSSWSTLKSGNDILVKVGKGSILLKDAAALSELNITDKENVRPLVTGTEDDDFIDNILDGATIRALGGNDTIFNGGEYYDFDEWYSGGHLGGDSVSIDGGDGDDSIYNNEGEKLTLAGGDGNDYIYNSFGESVSINGGNGNDYIVNGGYYSQSEGGDGNDTIHGGSYMSSIDGGKANDLIYSGGYLTSINGGDGDDSIVVDGNFATVDGGTGDDLIYNVWVDDFEESPSEEAEGGDNVSIDAGIGNDTIVSKGANVSINGGAGNDRISLGSGSTNNVIEYATGDGNDTIYGFNDSSTLKILDGDGSTQTSGNDIIVTVGDGEILLVGAASLESVNITAAPSQKLEITNSTKTPMTLDADIKNADASARTKAINITGNIYNNSIVGGKANDVLSGAAGDDTLSGGAGNDKLYGDEGNDVLQGGAGKDLFVYSAGSDTISDYTAGQDSISIDGSAQIADVALSGNDVVLGFGDSDSLTITDGADKKITFQTGKKTSATYIFEDGKIFNGKKTAVTLTAATTAFDASASVYSALLNINGSAATDAVNIVGNKNANKIFAGANGSTLNGGAGNDTLVGGNGADVFVYTTGKDIVQGYSADDKVSLGAGASIAGFSVSKTSDIVFKIGSGTLTLKKVDGDDLTAGKTVTIVDAKGTESTQTYFKDRSAAGAGVTLSSAFKGTFTAGDGVVSVDGSQAAKALTLNGNELANVLIGGKANDILNGNAGDDTLTGGTGKDLFVYSAGSDTITDYTAGQDSISIDGGAKINEVALDGNYVVLGFGDDDSLFIEDGAGKKITFKTGKKTSATYIFDDGKIFNGKKTAVTLTASTTAFDASASVYSALANVDGSAATNAVNIVGNKNANKIFAGANGSTLNGGAGNDTLTGGAGNDLFVYTAGNDTIADYARGDKISLGSAVTKTAVKSANVVLTLGKNTLTVKNAASKQLTLIDSAGTELTTILGGLTYNNKSKASVTLPSYAEYASAATRTKAIAITGNALDNTIAGGKGNNSITGGKGDDSLWGGNGADTFIYAEGDGYDVIGGFGDDDLLKITGAFTTAYDSAASTVKFTVGTGSITLTDFTASTFNVNGDTYVISGKQLVKK